MNRMVSTLCCSAAACGCLAWPALAQNRPNLIFIMTDDQGIDAIEWPPDTRGNTWVRTETLNALATQGVSFTNCRVNPNCSPTRACLMTGHHAIETGVNGVLGRYAGANPCEGSNLTGTVAEVTNRLALRTHEKTIAEVLHDLGEDGYYTILIDKWHLGYNEDEEDLGLLPTQQGFDEFFDWQDFICDGYEEDEFFADRHMLAMLDNAIDAVDNRGQGQPYALFFHTITPHQRHEDNETLLWWQIREEYEDLLIPQTKALNSQPTYPNNDMRFAQNLEAIDTVLRLLLIALDVIDEQTLAYKDASDTIVFFTSDNGTDSLVSAFGTGRAKNSLYEGGIRVPLFVMGEGVPGNTQNPIEEDRLVSHIDFYETICDIVQASASERNNPIGNVPRRGVTFADAINWGDPPATPRDVSLSSLGNVKTLTGEQIWRVALVQDRYKLICNSGGAGFDDMTDDEFYDIDPDEGDETVNMLEGQMTVEQLTAYYAMRDRVSDEWPTAVSEAIPLTPAHYTVDHFSGDEWFVLVGHIIDGEYDEQEDEFYDLFMDPDREDNLLLGSMTQFQQTVYNNLHAQFETRFEEGNAAPDLRVVDLPVASTLVMTDDSQIVSVGPLTIGHQYVGDQNDQVEFRARLTFNFSDAPELPPGFNINDHLVDAQIIVAFQSDSSDFDPDDPDENYLDDDRDTGIITIPRMITSTSDLFNSNNYDEEILGRFDPPPHIIARPFVEMQQGVEQIRVLPMPVGTPVSFGHNAELLDAVSGWFNSPSTHFGVMLKAEQLPGGAMHGDQHVHFIRDAVLRLTLDRQ